MQAQIARTYARRVSHRISGGGHNKIQPNTLVIVQCSPTHSLSVSDLRPTVLQSQALPNIRCLLSAFLSH